MTCWPPGSVHKKALGHRERRPVCVCMTFHLENSHSADLSLRLESLTPGSPWNLSDGSVSGVVLDTLCRSRNPTFVYLLRVLVQTEVYERPGDQCEECD